MRLFGMVVVLAIAFSQMYASVPSELSHGSLHKITGTGFGDTCLAGAACPAPPAGSPVAGNRCGGAPFAPATVCLGGGVNETCGPTGFYCAPVAGTVAPGTVVCPWTSMSCRKVGLFNIWVDVGPVTGGAGAACGTRTDC